MKPTNKDKPGQIGSAGTSANSTSTNSTSTNSKPIVKPERWLDEYGDWLFQFAKARVHDSHTAEDLVQETLIAGFRGFEKFENRSTVKTWLATIMRRRIADHFQKAGRQEVITDSVQLEDERDHFAFSVAHSKLFHPKIGNDEFQSSVEREEFLDSVRTCVAKLPAHLRQAFTQRIADDEKSIDVLSAELNITKNNLGVRLFRSRLLIRECLERLWTKQ